MVHQGVKDWVTAEYKRGYNCKIHSRGSVNKGNREIGFLVFGNNNWSNDFCCKLLKFQVQEYGETLLQKFGRFIKGKQLTKKDMQVFAGIIPVSQTSKFVSTAIFLSSTSFVTFIPCLLRCNKSSHILASFFHLWPQELCKKYELGENIQYTNAVCLIH